MTKLEEYDGLGFGARNVPSPYIWSGTDQYKSGKYIRDGVYDSAAVDSQPGCAGLLLAIMALDRTISFDGKMPPIVVSPSVTKVAGRCAGAAFALNYEPGTRLARRFHRVVSLRHLQPEKEMTMWTFLDAVVFAAGYAASIYSWPR